MDMPDGIRLTHPDAVFFDSPRILLPYSVRLLKEQLKNRYPRQLFLWLLLRLVRKIAAIYTSLFTWRNCSSQTNFHIHWNSDVFHTGFVDEFDT